MRRHQGAEDEQAKTKQEANWLKDNRRWFKELCTLANDVAQKAVVAFDLSPDQQHDLLEVVEPLMLQNLRKDER